MNEKKNFERLVIFAIAATMCLSALAVLPTVSAAGNYYVSPTGSDSNNGLTPTQAWATINKGTCSSSPLISGDILHVADGTYTITGRIKVEKDGITVSGNTASPGNVIVQYSPAANSLIFDMRANEVTVEGIKTISGKSGFYFDQSATGCTISRCIIENAYESGVYIYNGNGHTVEYTTITNPGQCGNLIYSNGIYTRAASTTIDHCTISSDKVKHMKWGIDLEAGSSQVITGNTITGAWQAAIRAASGVKPVTITNNDIDDATQGYAFEAAISLDGHNDGSIISGNHIDDVVASSAIGVWDAWDIAISGNQIGADDALNDVRLEGIRVIGCGGSGANRVEVTGNTIHNTGYAAVMLINSGNTYVYSNIIGDCNNYGAGGTGDWDYASIHVDENSDNVIVDSNSINDGINGIQVWGDNCQVTNNEIYDMGLTYANTKTTADGTYYNSGIIIGSNWLTSNFKPTGTTITGNDIHDNYWGLYVRDYATLSPSDSSVLSVIAECNWWGHATGPDDDAEVINGTGDKISTNVDAKPWYATSTTTPSTEYVTVEESPTVRAYSDTIQGGIDAAVAGNTVTVAAGTYQENVEVNKQLTLIGDPSTPSNVVVDAQGTGTRPIKITADGCTLRGFKTINSESYYGSIGVWSNNNIIKDNIASDNSGSSGIFLYGSSYNTIENNNVSNNGNWGINIYSRWVGPGYIACENNTIKNNIANGNGQEGIGSGVYANNNTIEDNQVNGNTYAGIGLFRCSGNTIKDNTVNGNGAIGINIYGTSADPCTYHTITGNTANDNGGDANILLGGYCHNNIVEDNTANNGHYGIRVSGDHNTVRKNTANGNSEDGMRLKGDDYTIEGNTCNLNDYRGIWVNGVTNSIVKNNILSNNNVGILLWTCHNSKLTGNTIKDNNGGVQIASDSPDNTIYCNNIVGNVNYGVKNEGTTEVNAECNWWGDTSGPSGVGLGTGDAVSTNVDFDPWAGKITGPSDPVQVGSSVEITGYFTCDMDTATFEWDDDSSDTVVSLSGQTSLTQSHVYTTPGVYTVTLTATDNDDGSIVMTFQYVVVYDPSAGFVTGGGWIDSPAGAYSAQPTLTGKANFGFVSKYKKGQPTPTGNTEFQFKAGNLNFHSDSYDWLVIAEHKAKYKGVGTIIGEGEYKFMLSAIDGDLQVNDKTDMFRIKIWWEEAIGENIVEHIVYDNKQLGDSDDLDQFEASTVLGGGQIVIHKAKTKTK